ASAHVTAPQLADLLDGPQYRRRELETHARGAATPQPAYRSGVAWLPHSRSAALAVGPTGTDLTTDAGRTWRTLDTGSYDTVDCTPDLGCWAAGEQGRVARLES
ncbi:hypothetical protein ABZT00_41600, partial [Streptomyces sp. NPDC005486]